MSDWDEYYRRIEEWHASGDDERLELIDLYHTAFACHETDPERTFALFTRVRDEALRLGEHWWVLFFESWRLTALTSHSMDFVRALPLAIQLTVEVNSPAGRVHSWKNSILVNVLYTYVCTDPVGYQREIEQAFQHLDADIPQEPVSDRFVLNHRWITFLHATERYQEARDFALVGLALADRAPARSTQVWHGSWLLFELCAICDDLGAREEVDLHATHLAELSHKQPQLDRAYASAMCWRAAAQQAKGNRAAASRFFHQGVAALEGLYRRDTVCAEPLARYHELSGDLPSALAVREQEIEALDRHGRVYRSCQVRLERCRLLRELGRLSAADIEATRDAMGKLRAPRQMLEKLAEI